jgi:hypothetical protein
MGLAVVPLLTVVLCRNLFFTSGWPAGWDMQAMLYPIGFFSRNGDALHLWEDSTLGYVTPLNVTNLWAIVNSFLGEPALVLRVVIILNVLLIGLSMYFFARRFTRDSFGATIAAIIYMANPWVLARFADGHIMHTLGYAFAPLLFVVLDWGVRRLSIASVFAFGSLLALMLLMRFDPIVYILPFLVLYGCLFVLSAPSSLRLNLLKQVSIFALASAVVFAFTSFVIWWPMLVVGTTHTSIAFDVETIKGTTFGLLPTLQGKPLFYSYLYWAGMTNLDIHQFLPRLWYELSSLIIPVIAFFALLVKRSNKVVWFFVGVALISIFFAKGLNAPFGEVYGFFLDHIPFWKQIHVPNRWLATTWLAYSLLGGITLTFLWRRIYDLTSLVRIRIPLASLVVTVLLAAGLLSSAYPITQGLQTWQPPESEIAPYQWVRDAGIPGRVISIPFGIGRMFIREGWMEQDLGYNSAMISGHSTIRYTEDQDPSGGLIDYVRTLVDQGDSTIVAKILGAFDSRFFVFQGYPPTNPVASNTMSQYRFNYDQHDYFEKQHGLQEVFTQLPVPYVIPAGLQFDTSQSLRAAAPSTLLITATRIPRVMENTNWVPRVYIPSRSMAIVGGPESLRMLAERDAFQFGQWRLLFLDRLAKEYGPQVMLEKLAICDELAFFNTDARDLAMLAASPKYLDLASDSGGSGWSPGISRGSLGWLNSGFTPMQTVRQGATLSLPFTAGSIALTQEIWVRVLQQPSAGKLMVQIDRQRVGDIVPWAEIESGYRWVKLGEIDLVAGSHKLDLINEPSSFGLRNAVDAIIVVDRDSISKAQEKISSILDHRAMKVTLVEDTRGLSRLTSGINATTSFVEVNSDQSSPLWRSADKSGVVFSTEPNATAPDGKSVSEMTLMPDSVGTDLAHCEYSNPQDWSEGQYLAFWFKGQASQAVFNCVVSDGWPLTASTKVSWSFRDDSSGWKIVLLPFKQTQPAGSNINWVNVTGLTLLCENRSLSGVYAI